MNRESKSDIKIRREKVLECIRKGLYTPALIVKKLEKDYNIPPEGHDLFYRKIENDLKWMRKDSVKWLSGHALDGFVFETRNAIEQMRDVESELQKMREAESDPMKKLKIIAELKDTINLRWVMQGDGPTLMNLRMKKHDTHTQNTEEPLRTSS